MHFHVNGSSNPGNLNSSTVLLCDEGIWYRKTRLSTQALKKGTFHCPPRFGYTTRKRISLELSSNQFCLTLARHDSSWNSPWHILHKILGRRPQNCAKGRNRRVFLSSCTKDSLENQLRTCGFCAASEYAVHSINQGSILRNWPLLVFVSLQGNQMRMANPTLSEAVWIFLLQANRDEEWDWNKGHIWHLRKWIQNKPSMKAKAPKSPQMSQKEEHTEHQWPGTGSKSSCKKKTNVVTSKSRMADYKLEDSSLSPKPF